MNASLLSKNINFLQKNLTVSTHLFNSFNLLFIILYRLYCFVAFLHYICSFIHLLMHFPFVHLLLSIRSAAFLFFCMFVYLSICFFVYSFINSSWIVVRCLQGFKSFVWDTNIIYCISSVNMISNLCAPELHINQHVWLLYFRWSHLF